MTQETWHDWFFDPKLVWVDTRTRTVDIIDQADGRGTYDKESPYFIRFEQLDSVCAFMRWLRHLSEKEWFTGMHLEQFVKCYEFLLRNEIVPQRVFKEQSETDTEDVSHDA